MGKQHVELVPIREFKDTLRMRVDGVDAQVRSDEWTTLRGLLCV